MKRKPSIFDGKILHVKRDDYSQSNLVIDACMSSFFKEWIGTKNNKIQKKFLDEIESSNRFQWAR
jgi:hypothetical protein